MDNDIQSKLKVFIRENFKVPSNQLPYIMKWIKLYKKYTSTAVNTSYNEILIDFREMVIAIFQLQ